MSKNLRGHSSSRFNINLLDIDANSITATTGTFTNLNIGTYTATTLNVTGNFVSSGLARFTGTVQYDNVVISGTFEVSNFTSTGTATLNILNVASVNITGSITSPTATISRLTVDTDLFTTNATVASGDVYYLFSCIHPTISLHRRITMNHMSYNPSTGTLSFFKLQGLSNSSTIQASTINATTLTAQSISFTGSLFSLYGGGIITSGSVTCGSVTADGLLKGDSISTTGTMRATTVDTDTVDALTVITNDITTNKITCDRVQLDTIDDTPMPSLSSGVTSYNDILIRNTTTGLIQKAPGLQFWYSPLFNLLKAETISVSQTISPLIGHDGGYMFKLPTNTPQVGYVLKILSINPHITSWVPSSDNITIPEPTACQNLLVREDLTVDGKVLLRNPTKSTTNANYPLVFLQSHLRITNDSIHYNPSTNVITMPRLTLSELDATTSSTVPLDILIRGANGLLCKIPNFNYTPDQFFPTLSVPNISVSVAVNSSQTVTQSLGKNLFNMFQLPTNNQASFVGDVLMITDKSTTPYTTSWSSVNFTNTGQTFNNLIVSSYIGKTTATKFSLPSNSAYKGLFLQCIHSGVFPSQDVPPITEWSTIPEPTTTENLTIRNDLTVESSICLPNPSKSTSNLPRPLVFLQESLRITNNSIHYNPSTNLMTLVDVNVTGSLSCSNGTIDNLTSTALTTTNLTSTNLTITSTNDTTNTDEDAPVIYKTSSNLLKSKSGFTFNAFQNALKCTNATIGTLTATGIVCSSIGQFYGIFSLPSIAPTSNTRYLKISSYTSSPPTTEWADITYPSSYTNLTITNLTSTSLTMSNASDTTNTNEEAQVIYKNSSNLLKSKTGFSFNASTNILTCPTASITTGIVTALIGKSSTTQFSLPSSLPTSNGQYLQILDSTAKTTKWGDLTFPSSATFTNLTSSNLTITSTTDTTNTDEDAPVIYKTSSNVLKSKSGFTFNAFQNALKCTNATIGTLTATGIVCSSIGQFFSQFSLPSIAPTSNSQYLKISSYTSATPTTEWADIPQPTTTETIITTGIPTGTSATVEITRATNLVAGTYIVTYQVDLAITTTTRAFVYRSYGISTSAGSLTTPGIPGLCLHDSVPFTAPVVTGTTPVRYIGSGVVVLTATTTLFLLVRFVYTGTTFNTTGMLRVTRIA